MFRQFFFIYFLLAALVGTSAAFVSSESDEDFDSNERIVVKAEPSLKLRTRRPIKFAPVHEVYDK